MGVLKINIKIFFFNEFLPNSIIVVILVYYLLLLKQEIRCSFNTSFKNGFSMNDAGLNIQLGLGVQNFNFGIFKNRSIKV